MFLHDTMTDKETLQKTGVECPFGPEFPQEQVDKADTLELWYSDFKDAGEDFCLFKLISKGKVIAERKKSGY